MSLTVIFQVIPQMMPLMQVSKHDKQNHHICHHLVTVLGGIFSPGH